MTTWLSPDCRDGNHQKCDRAAWDEEKDDGTDCGCECHVEVVDEAVEARRAAIQTIAELDLGLRIIELELKAGRFMSTSARRRNAVRWWTCRISYSRSTSKRRSEEGKTMKLEIVWKEPPARTVPNAILDELKRNPGRWAQIATDKASTSVRAPWAKLGCETQVHRNNPGETKPRYDLYVRWPEQKAPKPAVPPQPQQGMARTPVSPGGYLSNRAARGVPEDGKPVGDLHRHG